MHLSSRIGGVCCVQSRPIAMTWKRFKASSSPTDVCLDTECLSFLPWLEQKAGAEISSLVAVGKSSHGRCLVAVKPIREGEIVLKVPFGVQISDANMIPEIRSALGDEVGNVSKLALLLLIETRMGQILWSNDELQMIKQSSVFQETAKLKAKVRRDFEHIGQLKSMGKPKSSIPDFLNHDGTSEADLSGDVDKQCSEVIADRDYCPGEQVMIRYGKFSNATLLLDFGFTVPNNKYDQVCLELNIPSWDPLRMKKIEILQKHYTPAIRDINGFSSFWNSFIIKEVRLTSRNGRGIPQSLWAVARVLCSSSLDELHKFDVEATNKDGRLARIPLKDDDREFLAHQLLIAHIKRHIEEYDQSIKLLEDYSASPTRGGPNDIRRQMAINLLKGELRILASAHTWLEGHNPTK